MTINAKPPVTEQLAAWLCGAAYDSLPAAMSPAQVAYWEALFAKIVQTDDWKKDLEHNLWEDAYMGSSQSRKYLDGQYDELRRVLNDLGMAK